MKQLLTLIAFAFVGLPAASCSKYAQIQDANWRPRIILTSAKRIGDSDQPTGTPHGLTRQDIARIESTIPTIKRLIAWRTMPAAVQVPTTRKQTDQQIFGATAQLCDIASIRTVSGRFINEIDNSTMTQVLVIDESLAQELFDSGAPIGRLVDIMGQQFEVIGTFSNLEVNSDLADRVRCIVPIETMKKVFGDISITKTDAKDEPFSTDHYELSGCIIEVAAFDQLEDTQKLIENTFRIQGRHTGVDVRNNLPSQ